MPNAEHQKSTDINWQPREEILLLYQKSETNVGHDLYVCIQCLRETNPGQKPLGVYRQSSPYVLLWQYGSRRVIPGSVYESLKNLCLELEEFMAVLRDRVARIKAAEEDQRVEEYYEYARRLTNGLVLISCLARNLFHLFPRLSEHLSIQMYGYENQESGDMRMKDLLDLFVHNRYMNLHNEYITDLVSAKPSEGTVVTEMFMGHRFKFHDFLTQIRNAIESITIKDLTTRLRGSVTSLNLDTPYQEIVFLVQNTASFSDLLEAMIPSKSYEFILDLLFPRSEQVPKPVLDAAKSKGKEIQQTIKFTNPNVTVGGRLDEKKVQISVKVKSEYSVGGRLVHTTNEERKTDLDFTDFFDVIVSAFGHERLLSMARRIDTFHRA